MTLGEAIKSLENLEQHHIIHGWAASRDAIKLGIEALKRIKYRRDQGKGYEPKPLPGETEERTIQRHGKDIRGDYLYEEAQK